MRFSFITTSGSAAPCLEVVFPAKPLLLGSGIIKIPFLCPHDHSQAVFGSATAPSGWPLGRPPALLHSGTLGLDTRLRCAHSLQTLDTGGGGNCTEPRSELPRRAGAGPRGGGA